MWRRHWPKLLHGNVWMKENRKINTVSENKNQNIERIVNDEDKIRQLILSKFTQVKK